MKEFFTPIIKIELKQKLIHQFYQDYQDKLIKFAFALMRSQENAEEAVHNVFRKLWDSDKLSEIKNPYPYLIQCTKYESYAILAKEKKEKEVNLRFLKTEAEEKTPSENNEDKLVQLRKAIHTLPPKCKEIMLLKVDDGLTHQEISDYLKVSGKTVENQVTIAIKKIRNYLNKN
ncbi:MAG: RNA polymerase sigma factor [Bacteroidota bacterium]